ncbi:MAG: hypothetical protein AAF986_07350 [Pseudomonadota bacterium]
MGKDDISVAPIPAMGYSIAKRKGKISMFSMFPLLAVSLVLYSLAVVAGQPEWTGKILFELAMVSKDTWTITFGHGFIILSMVFLFVELLRATKTGTDSLVNHALSALLFIVALLLFIIVPGYGNSVFFIFMAMTFMDFMAGFIVTTVTARRDFGVAA